MTTQTGVRSFEVGDEIIVNLETRRMRATVVMLGYQFGYGRGALSVEDMDELIHTVYVDQCRHTCEGCSGKGYIDYQRDAFGDDEGKTEFCRACDGTGESQY